MYDGYDKGRFMKSDDALRAELSRRCEMLARHAEKLQTDANNKKHRTARKTLSGIIDTLQIFQREIQFSISGANVSNHSGIGKLKTKSVLINPAIPPLKDFEMYLGENENYSTGKKFKITREDIRYIRKMSYKKYANAENTYVLLESGDEVLNYKETAKYFSGSYLDVIYGGSHSYESLDEKLKNIVNFIEIH